MNTTVRYPCFLVALPQLQDPNFTKAVILLTEYNAEGARGYLVNRPSKITVSTLLKDNDFGIPKETTSWLGGPVGQESAVVLHPWQCPATSDEPDFELSSSPEIMARILRNKLVPPHPDLPDRFLRETTDSHNRQMRRSCLYLCRFLVGYAGWGPGQLDEEMKLGYWIQMPLSWHLLFDTPWQNMWNEAMLMLGINPARFAPTAQPWLN